MKKAGWNRIIALLLTGTMLMQQTGIVYASEVSEAFAEELPVAETSDVLVESNDDSQNPENLSKYPDVKDSLISDDTLATEAHLDSYDIEFEDDMFADQDDETDAIPDLSDLSDFEDGEISLDDELIEEIAMFDEEPSFSDSPDDSQMDSLDLLSEEYDEEIVPAYSGEDGTYSVQIYPEDRPGLMCEMQDTLNIRAFSEYSGGDIPEDAVLSYEWSWTARKWNEDEEGWTSELTQEEMDAWLDITFEDSLLVVNTMGNDETPEFNLYVTVSLYVNGELADTYEDEEVNVRYEVNWDSVEGYSVWIEGYNTIGAFYAGEPFNLHAVVYGGCSNGSDDSGNADNYQCEWHYEPFVWSQDVNGEFTKNYLTPGSKGETYSVSGDHSEDLCITPSSQLNEQYCMDIWVRIIKDGEDVAGTEPTQVNIEPDIFIIRTNDVNTGIFAGMTAQITPQTVRQRMIDSDGDGVLETTEIASAPYFPDENDPADEWGYAVHYDPQVLQLTVNGSALEPVPIDEGGDNFWQGDTYRSLGEDRNSAFIVPLGSTIVVEKLVNGDGYNTNLDLWTARYRNTGDGLRWSTWTSTAWRFDSILPCLADGSQCQFADGERLDKKLSGTESLDRTYAEDPTAVTWKLGIASWNDVDEGFDGLGEEFADDGFISYNQAEHQVEISCDDELAELLDEHEGYIPIGLQFTVQGNDLPLILIYLSKNGEEPGFEEYIDYQFHMDSFLLMGGEEFVDAQCGGWLQDEEHPDGEEFSYRITDLEVIETETMEGYEGDVVLIEEVREEQGDPDEGSVNGIRGWTLHANAPGYAIVKVSFTDLEGNDTSYQFRVDVGFDWYGVNMWPEEGFSHALPGKQISLFAEVEHARVDDDGEPPYESYVIDTTDPAVSNITYSWSILQNNNVASIAADPADPRRAIVTFNDMPAGQEELWEDIVAVVEIYEGTDKSGNLIWRGKNTWELTVASSYDQVWPSSSHLFQYPNVPEVITPELRDYKYGLTGDYTSRRNVRFRWYYDPGDFEVRDSQGNLVGNEDENGLYQGRTYADNSDTDFGAAYTVTRMVQYESDIHLMVDVLGENGNWEEMTSADWYTKFRRFSIRLDSEEDFVEDVGSLELGIGYEEGVKQDYFTPVFTVGLVTYDEEEGTLEWTRQFTPDDGVYTVTGDKITLDGETLSSVLEGDNPSVFVRAELTKNGEVLTSVMKEISLHRTVVGTTSVNYLFRSTSARKLPDEITALQQTLTEDTANWYSDYTLKTFDKTPVEVETGKWVFDGFQVNEEDVGDTIRLGKDPVLVIGYWSYEEEAHDVYFEHAPITADEGRDFSAVINAGFPTEYESPVVKGTVFAPTSPAVGTVVETTGGNWVFQGYEPASQKMESTDLRFKGTWKFEETVYKVTYRFVSSDESEELPEDVNALCPMTQAYLDGETLALAQPVNSIVQTQKGNWTFKGYDAQPAEVHDNMTVTGTWKYTEEHYTLSYAFAAAKGVLPAEVIAKLPENQDVVKGTQITIDDLAKLSDISIHVEEGEGTQAGTWNFLKYQTENVTVSDDVTVTAIWRFTADPKPDEVPAADAIAVVNNEESDPAQVAASVAGADNQKIIDSFEDSASSMDEAIGNLKDLTDTVDEKLKDQTIRTVTSGSDEAPEEHELSVGSTTKGTAVLPDEPESVTVSMSGATATVADVINNLDEETAQQLTQEGDNKIDASVLIVIEHVEAEILQMDVSLMVKDQKGIFSEVAELASPVTITVSVPTRYRNKVFTLIHYQNDGGERNETNRVNVSYSWADENHTAITFVLSDLSPIDMEMQGCLNEADHVWGKDEAHIVEKKDPTCAENGYIVYQCVNDCKATHKEVVPALVHEWGEPTYEWSEDNKSVTATRVCVHDLKKDHVETETVNATSEVTKAATCEAKGEATCTSEEFTNTAFEKQTKTFDIAPLGHTYKEHAEQEATAEQAGNIKYFTCDNGCGKLFVEKEGTKEEIDETSLNAVNAVWTAIGRLKVNGLIEKEAVEAAAAAFDGLKTEDQDLTGLVPASAVAKLQDAKAVVTNDEALIKTFDDAIAEVKGTGLPEKSKVETAQAAYASLKTENKDLTGYVAEGSEKKLTDALAAVAADEALVKAFDDAIAEVKGTGLNEKSKVETAQTAYANLKTEEKDLTGFVAEGTEKKLKDAQAAVAADEALVKAFDDAIAEVKGTGLAEKSKLEAAQAAYANLKTEDKDLTGFVAEGSEKKLTDAQAAVAADEALVKAFDDAIAEVKGTGLNEKSKVEAAQAAYANLKTEDKDLTGFVAEGSVKKLTDAQAAVTADEALVKAFDDAIAEVKGSGLDEKAKVEAAQAAYASLKTEDKDLSGFVAEGSDKKLTDAQAAVAADEALVKAFDDAIAEVKGSGLDEKAKVEAAQAAYANLKTEDKDLSGFITEGSDKKLTDAQAAVAADEALVKAFDDAIAEVNGTGLDEKAKVEAAQAAYASLKTEDKDLSGFVVEGSDKKLTDAQAAVAEDEALVKAFTDAIAKVNGTGLAEKDKVEEARSAYEALKNGHTDLTKLNSAVPSEAVTKLTDAEAAVKKAEAEALVPKPAKPGTVLETSNAIYQVLSDGTVTFKSPKNKGKITKVNVPNTVKIGGITYRVTKIANNALRNAKKLKTATIGTNIVEIGKCAFLGAKALKKVTIRSNRLKKIGAKAFLKAGSSNYKKLTVKVPKAKKKSYAKKLKKAKLSSSAKVK